jgi:pimeloyl-ACP methyl ester carboxylesterase
MALSVSLESLEQLIGAERLAFMRQATLLHRDIAPVVPRVVRGDHVVILIHGFLASAGVFRPLRARLERETGARVATFSHAPGVGIRRIAARLAELVDRVPHAERITVIGHSLGGLVARWYVQEMGGQAHVTRTISLAAPFHGVDVPQLFVGADVHERSALLRRLRERAADCRVPHTSIVAADDRTVPGVETACLGVGDVVVLANRGHNTLLFDDEAAGLIIDRVKRSGL